MSEFWDDLPVSQLYMFYCFIVFCFLNFSGKRCIANGIVNRVVGRWLDSQWFAYFYIDDLHLSWPRLFWCGFPQFPKHTPSLVLGCEIWSWLWSNFLKNSPYLLHISGSLVILGAHFFPCTSCLPLCLELTLPAASSSSCTQMKYTYIILCTYIDVADVALENQC